MDNKECKQSMELSIDSDTETKLNALRQGYGLDILINDSDECVRTEAKKMINMLKSE